ncbi:hypothetical protein [Streptomyces sp. NPDC002054]|uniref:hypothetical protein n=1 Tax=Streptomyces sp. NPDC002054 TaxID=3154663 RepID=UPI003318F83B
MEQYIVTLSTHTEPQQSWIVLDVDRTLMNTTAWYHACASPGLLLDEHGVQEFLSLNDRAYGPQPTLSDVEFRRRTLDLINASPLGPWTAQRMEDAGAAVAARLALYPEVAGYLRHLHYRQDPGLRILFLSAGYRPFIAGVVEGLLARCLLTGLPYEVAGSTLEFEAGQCRLGTVVDGDRKADAVRNLLGAGARIELLADDSYHDHELFDLVERAGGRTVRVVHERGARSSRSWREFTATLPDVESQARLTTGAATYALADLDEVFAGHGHALANLPPADNGIGVGAVPQDLYLGALDDLCRTATGDPAERARLRELLLGLTQSAADRVLLRGRLFHLAAPPYLFADPTTGRERWTEALDVSLDCLRILADGGVLAGWEALPRAQRWIVVGVLDHLKNAATHALDVLVKSNVADDAPDALDDEVERLVEDCHLAYWSTVFDAPQVADVLAAEGWSALRRAVGECTGTPFAMRELDDPRVIAVSALSLAGQLEQSGDWPVGLIDFPSGALDLGLAFRVIARLTRPDKPAVGVAHMAYSSKNAMRGLAEDGAPSFGHLMSRVPKHFRERIHEWLDGDGTVVLYDNNVTTFATLAHVKRLLGRHASARIRATVACVNYENIARHLRGAAAEPLCEGWEEVLDLRPVADYLTAFATWGTSAKTQALHRMYAALPAAAPHLPATLGDGQDWLFKVCRVHNAVDLAAVVRAGANAIGVHAVSPREPAYFPSQARHVPVLPPPAAAAAAAVADLPLAHHETASVRAMAAALPEGLVVAVVMEDVPTAGDWRRIRTELGLPASSALQLQCRVTAEEIALLRQAVTGGLICAIGADQADFAAYFRFLDGLLDPATDHILVDSSAHQPDLITGARDTPDGTASPLPRPTGDPLPATAMRGNRVPVLVADDVPADVLLERCRSLRRQGVRVAGCDTQNSVEAPKPAQRYRLVGSADVQALVRKSPDLLAPWATALAHHMTSAAPADTSK